MNFLKILVFLHAKLAQNFDIANYSLKILSKIFNLTKIKTSTIMLNTDLLDNLYAGLTKEQQQSLITLLFKNSKQTMNYFKRTKDVGLSKLETLSDFFHMPIDYFRLGNSFSSNNVSGNNNYVGNVSLSNNLLIENQSLRKELENIKATMEAKDDNLRRADALIQSKNEIIKVMGGVIEDLRKQLASKE